MTPYFQIYSIEQLTINRTTLNYLELLDLNGWDDGENEPDYNENHFTSEESVIEFIVENKYRLSCLRNNKLVIQKIY